MRAFQSVPVLLFGLVGLSSALSKNAVKLFDHAFEKISVDTLTPADKAGFSLPGASDAIPIRSGHIMMVPLTLPC